MIRKNILKKIAVAGLCFSVMFTSVACSNGKQVGGEGADANDKRPAMYVSVFNGGYGRTWLDTIVRDFNKENPDNKYKIVVQANKDEFNTIKSQLAAKTFVSDIFINNHNVYQLIDAGYLEDISDVWASDPDNNGSTIEQLMYDAENYKLAYGDREGGLYALPLQESLRGFVYDHDLFLKYKLLFNDEGNFISSATEKLSKGKDGIEGTYDDGHPMNEAQWKNMCEKAKSVFGYVFSYTGKFANYVNDVYYMLYAQYEGLDGVMLNYTYDGSSILEGASQPTTITMENGYQLVEQSGRKFALEWMDQWLATKDPTLGVTNKWTNPKAGNLSFSHTDAQNDFILSAAQNKSTKSAMLIEGDWWENEAKNSFVALEEQGQDEYKFRTRNYKFMTLPIFEGQKAKGSVYTIAENMYVSVVKQTDSNKKQICHDFVKFMYKDKYIQNFTVESGGLMPYDVELTDEQKKQLSPFVNNFLEIYKDREHNQFINYQQLNNASMVSRSSAFPGLTKAADSWVIINALYTKSAAQVLDDMRTTHNKNDWGERIEVYNKYVKGLK